jgi:uncharacterized membrane protein
MITSTEIATQSHTGPLPHPSVLKLYNDVMPGLAERIVTMAENQSSHRLALETASVEAEIAIQKKHLMLMALGQFFSFIVSMTGIIGGVYVAIHGKEWVGGIVGAGGVSGLVIGIIQLRRKPVEPPRPQQ